MTRLNKLIIWILLLAPCAYLGFVWNKLPQQVPMHYNIKGEIDRYGSKTELLIVAAILFLVSAGVYFILTNIHRIDPKKKYTANNLKQMKRLAFIMVVFLSALTLYIIYESTQKGNLLNGNFVFAGIGALFVVLGNYMHSARPNYFFGMRLPWTLESEDNWRYTHRIAGRLWFAGGLLMIPLSLLLPASAFMILFFIILAIITIIPVIASYLFYQKNKK